MSEIRTNLLKSERGDASPSAPFGLRVSGVCTATTFKGNLTGAASQLATDATGANLTLSGNLGVAGTITYEDVARVDATGISTFREGFGVGPLAGIALTAYKDGSIRTSGVVTATSYYGSGANLTGITGTTINTNADNRVITGSGTANTLNGEANLTFDGSTLTHKATNDLHHMMESGTAGYCRIAMGDSDDDNIGQILYNNANNKWDISGNAAVRVEIESDGDVKINTGNVIIGTAGKGIDFSAQTATSASGASMSAELLDHYEEGSFTAKAYQGGSAITLNYHNTHGRYTRVGNMVTVWMWVRASGTTSSTGGMQIGGLPFASASDSYRPSITGRAYGLRNFSGNSGINFWMNGSSSVIEVVTIDGNGLAQASNTNNNVWTGGAEVHATFSYFV